MTCEVCLLGSFFKKTHTFLLFLFLIEFGVCTRWILGSTPLRWSLHPCTPTGGGPSLENTCPGGQDHGDHPPNNEEGARADADAGQTTLASPNKHLPTAHRIPPELWFLPPGTLPPRHRAPIRVAGRAGRHARGLGACCGPVPVSWASKKMTFLKRV